MNKPGIPNGGDTVKIIEVSKEDSHYPSGRALGAVGVAENIYKESDVSEGWVGFEFYANNVESDVRNLYKVRVRILKRKKGKENK